MILLIGLLEKRGNQMNELYAIDFNLPLSIKFDYASD